MAGKGGHNVPDVSVLERRLRPIYDWIDAANYKKAIQECEKVLRKSPKLGRVQALKALALLRLGRETECNAILKSLRAETITDDAFLQAITLCYREQHKHEEVCKLYEEAVKADPSNEELHTHLFMSYVRISDFKMQQQSAMALYKLQPKNPYYCWAVMSVILQATRGIGKSDDAKRSLLLSLAERMLDKIISDNKLDAEQEVQLYIMILNEKGKHEKVLEVLDGPMGGKLSGDSVQNRLPHLIKLHRWPLVNQLCRKVLIENMDRWDIWLIYLNSVFELNKSNEPHDAKTTNHVENSENASSSASESMIDDTPEKAHEFLCKLLENSSSSSSTSSSQQPQQQQQQHRVRGPYLARFELARRLGPEESQNLLGSSASLFLEYFREFGQRACCVSDLRIYLELLATKEQRSNLAVQIIEAVGLAADKVEAESEAQMQRHICAMQLSRLCGCHQSLLSSNEQKVCLAVELQRRYAFGRREFGAKLLSTDQAPADAYVVLAAHLLYDVFVSSAAAAAAESVPHEKNDKNVENAKKAKENNALVTAVVMLKHALKSSPSNFHIKLLLVRIYHLLGCSREAHAVYQTLDVKHLQLDSLCHIHCYRLSRCAYYSIANCLLDTTVKFFSVNYRDSCDNLTFSYKFGSFAKLCELMDFRERMRNSFLYAATATDKAYSNLAATASATSSVDPSNHHHQQHNQQQQQPPQQQQQQQPPPPQQQQQQQHLYHHYPCDMSEVPDLQQLQDAEHRWRNNSDLSVYVTYEPQSIATPMESWPENSDIYEQDVQVVKVRALMLNALKVCFELATLDSGSSNRDQHLDRLERTLKEARKVNAEIGKWKPKNDSWPSCLSVCLPSRLTAYKQSGFFDILDSAFGVPLDLLQQSLTADKKQQHLQDRCETVKRLLENLTRMLCASIATDDCRQTRQQVELLSAFIEIVSVLCALRTIFASLARRNGQAKRSKKQQQQQQQDNSSGRECVQFLVSALRESIGEVDKCLGASSSVDASDEHKLAELVKSSLTITEDEQQVALFESKRAAILEARNVLKAKSKLLNVVS